jgi:hypothetical protein
MSCLEGRCSQKSIGTLLLSRKSYKLRIGSVPRSGTSRVIARCWRCE